MKNYSNFSMVLVLSFFLITTLGCSEESTQQTDDLFPITLKGKSGEKFNFSSSLKGSNEVPARETNAAGQVIVRINKDEQSLYYKIIASNIDNVVAAHFHLAPAGENGPVVTTLYTNPAHPSGAQNGILSEGVITSADLQGPFTGSDFSALVEAIRAGEIYVNVHSSRYPSGELRAQL